MLEPSPTSELVCSWPSEKVAMSVLMRDVMLEFTEPGQMQRLMDVSVDFF